MDLFIPSTTSSEDPAHGKIPVAIVALSLKGLKEPAAAAG